MRYFTIAILFFLIASFAIISINSQTGHYFRTNDYFFHLYMAKGECFVENYHPSTCQTYPPLFSVISAPFVKTELSFVLFAFSLVFLVIPFVIYSKTKSVLSLLIYFSSSFAMNVIFASIFAQALISLLFVLMLRNENLKTIDFFYLLLGLVAHSKGIYLLGLVFIWKIGNMIIKKLKIKHFFPAFVFLLPERFSFDAIFKLMPLVFYYYIFKLDFLKQILIFILITASFMLDYRISLFIPLALAYWLPEILHNKTTKFKILLGLSLILYSFFQLFFWFLEVYELGLKP